MDWRQRINALKGSILEAFFKILFAVGALTLIDIVWNRTSIYEKVLIYFLFLYIWAMTREKGEKRRDIFNNLCEKCTKNLPWD